MTTDTDHSRQKAPQPSEQEPSVPGTSGLQENMLLLSGVGLVLLAVAMALSNILA